DRVISLTYGSSTISGRQITTGCIQSLDGGVGFDLDNGQIWGTINFTRSPTTKTAIETMATDAGTTAANSAISNIQIGGRNYLLNSDGSKSDKITLHGGASLSTLDGVKCVKADKNTTSCGFYASTSQMSSAINGNTTDEFDWVLSVDVYASAANIDCQWGLGYGERETIATVGAWHRLTKSVKSSLKTFVVYKVNNNGTLYFKNWKLERGNVATDWTPAPEDETAALETLGTTISGLSSDIVDLQGQIDGKIDTWFKTVDPTTSNEPASTWDSTAKAEHKDDLYYNTTTGDVFRWTGSEWAKVQDSQIQEALDNASTAQATADGKMTVFTATPSNYKRGDMWVQGASGDIKYATKNGTTYVAADWVVASKYTDDTEATKAQLIANAAPNIYPDHNFEHNYWTIGNAYSGAITAPTGGGIRLITGRDIRGSYSFRLVAGHTYKLSVWAQRISGSVMFNMSLWWGGQTSGYSYDGYAATLVEEETSGNWTRYSRILTPDAIVGNPASAQPYFQIAQDYSSTDTQWIISDYIIEDYTAEKAANDAASAAAVAATQAAAAQTTLSNYASDSKIAPTEKTSLKQQLADINAEYTQISNDATRYSLKSTTAWTNYNTSKSKAVTALGYYTASTPDFIDIITDSSSQYYYANIAAYYGYRQTILEAIAAAAKTYADTVAEEAAAAAVDALDYVGRNVLRSSRSFELGSSSNWADGTWRASGSGTGTRTRLRVTSSGYPENPPVLTDVWLFTSASATSGETSMCQQYITDMEIGKKYTLSCYARATSGTPKLYLENGRGNISQTEVTDEWQRYTLTVTNTAAQMSTGGGGVIYIGHYSSVGTIQICGIKLEKGENATPWCSNDADQDYLSDALAEASANVGGTTVKHGLVLSSFIGVRDNSDNVVAGMTATKDANGNKMPMIFAGAGNGTTNPLLGRFRVYNTGTVESYNKAETQRLQYDSSLLNFEVKNGTRWDKRNVITSALANGITNMLAAANMASRTGTCAAKSGSTNNNKTTYFYFTNNQIAYPLAPNSGSQQTIPFSAVTLIAANVVTSAYVFSYDGFTLNIKGQNSAQGSSTQYSPTDWFSITNNGAFSGTYSVMLNSTTIKSGSLSSLDSSSGTNITIEAGAINVAANAAVTLSIVIKGTWGNATVTEKYYSGSESAYLDDYGNYKINIPFTRYANMSFTTTAFDWVVGQKAYCNTFYANALILAQATFAYLGIDPAMTDGDLLRMEAGASQTSYNRFRLNKTNGLLFSQGSSSWWRLNPLALIVRVTWNSSTSSYSKDVKYNPRGITPSVAIDGDSCKITHNLGTSDYSANVVIRSNTLDARRPGVQVDIQSTYARVNIGDHGNSWRADFDIFFYDYSTL
ncbi:MAG: hypothetical protein IKR17_02940, partial [Bacteroidales bacterium]|nr:hypothetical protein [Bacteroidales bacterium]